MNSARSIPRLVGKAAATPAAPAFASSCFWSSSVRRCASASTASCLLAKPTSPINRRSCRVEPGALNRYRQTAFPDPYLRLNTGISSPPLPLVGVEVQRRPDGRRCQVRVPCDDPPPAQADPGNDPLFQHRVDCQATDV